MKTLLKRMLVVVSTTVGLSVTCAFGAMNVTQASYSVCSQIETADNLLRDIVPTVDKYQTRPTVEGGFAAITDGVVDVEGNTDAKNGTMCIYKAGTTFTFDLTGKYANGCNISGVRFYGGWGSHYSRAYAAVASIEYATVDAPEEWIVIPGSVGTAGGSLKLNSLTFTADSLYLARRVAKLRITGAEAGPNGGNYHGCPEIEAYGVMCGDYALADRTTLSADFAGGSPAALTHVVAPEQMGEYFQSESDALPGIDAVWQSLAAALSSQAFTEGGSARDVRLYTWYRADASAAPETWVCQTSDVIRLTMTFPTATSQLAVQRVFDLGSSVTIRASELDQGSVGGTDPGDGDDIGAFEVPLHGLYLAVKSAPEGLADGDDDPQTVTVSAAGEYVLWFSAMNEAGLATTNEVALSVTVKDPDAPLVWTGVTSDSFSEPGNWNPAEVPTAGRKVHIPAGAARSLILAATDYPATSAFASFVVEEGATVVCRGDTTAINAEAGGTSVAKYGRGVVISADEITINGTLDANNQGFAAGKGPQVGSDKCAGHGGVGRYGDYYYKGLAGADGIAYGRADAPTELGSGGWGPGGGAIKLAATGKVTVNGMVQADGSDRGSGGSVWIIAGTEFAGDGVISARCRSEYSSRSGSSGRVALEYETKSFTGTLRLDTARGGASTGAPGTLYEPGRYPVGTAETPAEVTISGEEFVYVFPDDGETRYWNLSVGNRSRVGFIGGTLHLGDITLADASDLSFACWSPESAPSATLAHVGDISLAGGAMLALPGGDTMKTIACGTVEVSSGARLCFGCGDLENYLRGGVKLAASGDVTINGTLSVACVGSYKGHGKLFDDGGAPYGGDTRNTGLYGSLASPQAIGAYSSEGIAGGAIEIRTPGTLTLNGTVTADGSGRSSGGSIWLRAGSITGTGTVRAVPGTGDRPGAGGRLALEAADYSFTGSFNVAPGCYKNSNPSQPGTIFLGKGTLPLEYSPVTAVYTAEGFTSANHPISSAADATAEALVVERVYSRCSASGLYEWVERCYRLKDGSIFENGVTYTVSGLKPNVCVEVMHNGVAILSGEGGKLRADADGVVSFPATLVRPGGDVFSVRQSLGLTIMVR